jgi:8-oxo-dGTP pyrophosphatase MutT (NUDIX family)
MNAAQKYGESVLFAFIKGALILCEWRERRGVAQFSVPGGQIDSQDRAQVDYQRAALFRETWEEFRVIPIQYQRIGEIWYKEEWVFHVYLIDEWQGEIPTRVFDTQRPLAWIDPADLEDNFYMVGISSLMRNYLTKE